MHAPVVACCRTHLSDCFACTCCRYAEAEIARAREAAQQMVALSNQIQQMFNLCEASAAVFEPCPVCSSDDARRGQCRRPGLPC